MVANYNEVLYQNHRIETKRLILRRFELRDAADLLEYASDAATVEFLIWDGVQTIEAATASIYDYYWSRPGIWAVELTTEGKMIGCIDTRVITTHDRVEFGYVFNRKYWNKGYATEALRAVTELCFDKLHTNRVAAQHYAENGGSGRVMEKAGMKREGCLRQHEIVKGKLRDCVQYGIVRGDYYVH